MAADPRTRSAGSCSCSTWRAIPAKLHDVSGDHPDVVAKWGEVLARQRALDRELNAGLAAGMDEPEFDESFLQELRGLGYIQGDEDPSAEKRE